MIYLNKALKILFRISLVLTAICIFGTLFVFFHSYYLTPYRTVKNTKDPRWRIFDYNSRQATEGEIYNIAEVPAITKVSLIGKRRLRFEFTPKIKTSSWKILAGPQRKIIHQGKYPEIQFPDTLSTAWYIFVPQGISLYKEMKIRLTMDPKERVYIPHNLSWPDNYYTFGSQIPFSLKEPYSINEWAGISDDDPEMIEARRILKGVIDENVPTLERSAQLFRFIMEKIEDATGCPSDELQAASPLETYHMLISGRSKGWCENNALVYYLFANAVGIKTRLVDRAGKFGPLKLTGHYFCESWIPEYAKWVYVDAMHGTAHIKNRKGIPIHTLELKKYFDMDAFNCLTWFSYDKETNQLIQIEGEKKYDRLNTGLAGEIVFAYKFGYGRNKTYSKIKDYLFHTTMLWAPFALPRCYLVKYLFLYGLYWTFVITLLSGIGILILRRKREKRV